MFEGIRKTGNEIYQSFIPVVYAQELPNTNNNTVWTRLKRSVSTNEYESLSPEMANILSISQFGVFAGAMIGGCIYSKNRYMHFIETANASVFKHHMDAKNHLTNQMIGGAIQGSFHWGVKSLAVSIAYGILLNIIPVLRDENSWPEYVLSGLGAGTLAGYLFNDREILGIKPKKYTGKYSYKTISIMRGVKYGLLFGLATGFYSYSSKGQLSSDLRKFEKHWKERQQSNESTSTKST